MPGNPAPLAAEMRPLQAAWSPAEPTHAPQTSRSAQGEGDFWGADGFDFGDLLDLVNPLHHLPVVSALHREITGDAIAPGPRLIGSAVFGGPVGVAASMVNLAVENATGRDIGAHAMALFDGGGETPPTTATVASAQAASDPVEWQPARGAAAGAEAYAAAERPPNQAETARLLALFEENLLQMEALRALVERDL